jgi:hypothetical protein
MGVSVGIAVASGTAVAVGKSGAASSWQLISKNNKARQPMSLGEIFDAKTQRRKGWVRLKNRVLRECIQFALIEK